MRKRHIISIDIARFMAAIAVACYHLGFKVFVDPSDSLYHLNSVHTKLQGSSFFALGWIGVQIFFVISGFVIAYSAQGENIGVYAKRRFLRLVPAVWIAVPVCSFVAIFGFHETFVKTAVQASRTIAFLPVMPWIIGQFWTLPLEIVFYVCVGVLIAFRRVDRLESFAVALALLSTSFWVVYEVFHVGGHGQRLWQLMLLQHGIFFAIGIVIYRASVSGLTVRRLLFLTLCLVPAFFQIRWASQWEGIGISPQIRQWGAFGIWFIFTLFISISSMTKDFQKSRLLTRLIKTLGAATYPLYLFHYHVGGWLLISLLAIHISVGLSFVASIIVSVILAIWIALYVEPFVRRHLSCAMESVFQKLRLYRNEAKYSSRSDSRISN